MSRAEARRRSRRNVRIVVATIAAVIIVIVSGVLVAVRPAQLFVDRPAIESSATSEQIGTLRLTSYCPAQMALADTGEYGDSEFQASAGDLASTVRYAAFGSVFQASASPLDSDAGEGSDTLDATMDEDADALGMAGSLDAASRLFDVRLLESTVGTGAAASMASWATTGDLKGMQAATCVVPALSQSLLVSDTHTGTTQQLVVANPSSKPTSLEVKVWGSVSKERMKLSTGGTLTVAAHGEAVMDLSAAAADQDALYVTVDSEQTPVAAVVRTVRMDGLTSKGSDFVVPLGQAQATSIVSSIQSEDTVRLLAHATHRTAATLSWVTEQGLKRIKTVELEGGRATAIDLGKAPSDALALCVAGEGPVDVAAEVSRSGQEGQADFAVMNAGLPAASSAIALPDGSDGELTLANLDNAAATVTLAAYGPDGEDKGSRDIELPANAAKRITIGDLGDDVASVTLDDADAQVSWSARLTRGELDKADMAGVAHVDATALTPRTERIWSSRNPGIVR